MLMMYWGSGSWVGRRDGGDASWQRKGISKVWIWVWIWIWICIGLVGDQVDVFSGSIASQCWMLDHR